MKVFTYSEARQNLAKLLVLAQTEEIEIRRRDGTVFALRVKNPESGSPFDVPGMNASITTDEIVAAVREGRER